MDRAVTTRDSLRWRVYLRLMRLADVATQVVYRLSGGRLGERQLAYSILLLHTVGRKTGRTRTHALLYIRDGDNFVVCASNFGSPRHPAWYLNLMVNPCARIQAGQVETDVSARTAGPDERRELWPRFLAVRPQYAEYQAATAREIPIVILTPLSSSG
jgi:deazaflavin-dependent oxidoreductase (nitroreductase family)